MTTIIFGGIGTIVETSEWQREAFNAAFVQAGIDCVWDAEAYRATLAQSGGQNRLRSIRTRTGDALSDDQIARVHALKTQIYADRLATSLLTLRPGVAMVLDRAARGDLALFWATTTLRANIDAIFAATPPALSRAAFVHVADASEVSRQKPDPQIYEDLIAHYVLDRATTVAIEDNPDGVAAAAGAGLIVLGFPGEMTSGLSFPGAARMIASADEVVLSTA